MADLLPAAHTRHEKITQSLHQGHNIVRVGIPSYHVADDVVVYEVDVSNKKLRWNLWLRFEFFYVLHQMMQELVAELSTPELTISLPPFPDKRLKLFTDHFNEHFIENRRMLLDNYLQKILANRYLRHSEIFISFLTPPDNEELDTKSADGGDAEHHDDHKEYGNDHDHNEEVDALQNGKEAIHGNDGGDKGSANADGDDVDSKADALDDDTESQIIAKFISTKDVEFVDVDENDEITACTIPQAQVLKHDHTIYQIHVENHNISDEDHCRWTVMKRFQDFCSFDTEIRSTIINDYPDDVSLLPPLPPKYFKILVDHLDETFIEKRRLLLQCYIQRLCKYPLLRRHDHTLKFFQVTGYQ